MQQSSKSSAMLACAIWLLFVHVFVTAVSVNAQEQSQSGIMFDELPVEIQRFKRLVSSTDEVYQITFDGLIHRNFIHRRMFRTPSPLLELISNPTVAAELDISRTDLDRIENQVARISKACQQASELYEEWNSKNAKDLETSIIAVLEPPVDEAIRLIQELIQNKRKRFKQILLQLEINRRGLLWLIESKPGDEIGFSSAQKQAIRSFYAEHLKSALKQIQQFKKAAVDGLFANIPTSARQDLISKLGDRSNLFRTPLKLMIVQLDSQALKSFREFERKSQWARYAGISLPFSFKVSETGEIIFSPPTETAESVDNLIPTYLLSYCLQNGELEMVGDQKIAIKKLRQTQIELWESQQESINQWIQENNNYDLPANMRQNWLEDRRVLNDRIVETIEEILLPHQLSVMQEFAARTKYSLHGPLAFIFGATETNDGTWLDSIQENKLNAAGEEFRKTANEKLVEMESQLNRNVWSQFTEEQRLKFETLVGPWLDLESGNLEMHAVFLDRPEEIWGLNQQPVWLKEFQFSPKAIDK